MRHEDRVRCLATLEYRSGDAIIVCQCAKDARHGHGKKRQGFLYHRVDFGDIKVRWPGVGVMPPELAERRRVQQEAYRNRKRKQGELTWDGHECQ